MFNKNDFLNQIKNANPWTKCAVVFFLTAVVIAFSRPSPSTITQNEIFERESLSTFIPVGQRMVPIEILNSEALDSILGRYGIVDLYLPGQKRSFARGVKIVKSIDGSGAWAALVSESLADELMAAGTRFHVAVQPIKGSAESHLTKSRPRRTIVYEEN